MKKIKVSLAIFLVICMVSTMCFAAPLTTAKKTTEQAENAVENKVVENVVEEDAETVDEETDEVVENVIDEEATLLVAENEDLDSDIPAEYLEPEIHLNYVSMDSDKKVDIVDKLVDGSVYVIASDCIIENTKVVGDAYIICSGDVRIVNSTVHGNVYIAAENITFEGTVVNDTVQYAKESIKIDENSQILRTSLLSSKKADLSGVYGRNVYAYVDEVAIGDYTHVVGTLNVPEGTVDEATFPEKGIAVEGGVKNTSTFSSITGVSENSSVVINAKEVAKSNTVRAAIIGINALVAILVMLFLLQRKQDIICSRDTAITSIFKNLGMGILGLILTLVAIVLLTVSVIGIPVALLLLVVILLSCYYSVGIAATSISKALFAEKEGKKTGRVFVFAVLIAAIICGLELTPASSVITIIVSLISYGTMFRMFFANPNNVGRKTKKVASAPLEPRPSLTADLDDKVPQRVDKETVEDNRSDLDPEIPEPEDYDDNYEEPSILPKSEVPDDIEEDNPNSDLDDLEYMTHNPEEVDDLEDNDDETNDTKDSEFGSILDDLDDLDDFETLDDDDDDNKK